MIPQHLLESAIQTNVAEILKEDVGQCDLSALLISPQEQSIAHVITRENMILAGQPWVNGLIQYFDPSIEVIWEKNDGDLVKENEVFLILKGASRSLLTIERSILNFVQTLSAVATKAYEYSKIISGYSTTLIDTRKTIPGLRIAQKYAVSIGGGKNHRLGLFDAFLIKENHIIACGSISKAVQKAKQIAPDKPIEVEVETWDELEQALSTEVDVIMLDNFTIEKTSEAVKYVNGRCKIEASGGVTLENLKVLAEAGVDYISMGDLTKNIRAIDLSMRFT